jgi:signal transduction histidine kinase
LCLGQDITQRRIMEQRLVHSHKMEAVGQLAAGIGHDFNNFLTIIIGYSEMLLETCGADEVSRESLKEVRKAADRCAALTRQLLLFGRKHVHNPVVVNLNEVIRDTEEMLRSAAGDEVVLTITLDPELGLVKADPVQLEQVLLNLVLNSRDAMPDGGQLAISTANVNLSDEFAIANPKAEPGSYISFTVRDTGSGMSDEVRSHLFEPFFTTKELGKGTGLGLPVVHGVVTQSDGHIEVESQVGAGSSFTIYLPRM